MVTLLKKAALIAVVLWIGFTASTSFLSVPIRVAKSLAQSAQPDLAAQAIAQLVRTYVKVSPQTTVLYLNGIDGGDNFYRVRYLLYPLHFVDYWSWSKPNAGGEVWNAPRFSTIPSLRRLLLADRVAYVIATRHPHMAGLLGYGGEGTYLFSVQRDRLRNGDPLKEALTLIAKRPQIH